MPPRKSTDATKKRGRPTQAERSDAEDSGSDASVDVAPARGKKAAPKQKAGKKGKAKNAPAAETGSGDDEEESEEEVAGGKEGKKAGLSDEQKQTLAQEIARHALFSENARKPLKSQDLSKTLLADGKSKYFNELFPSVQKRFKNTFGMELVLLRPKEGAGKTPTKTYILRSTIPVQLLRAMNTFDDALLPKNAGIDHPPDNAYLADIYNWRREQGYMRDIQKEDGGAYGLLGVILGLILVSGKVLGDDQLVSYLKRLAIYPESMIPSTIASTHNGLTLTAFLNLLVKQSYLEKLKSAAPGGATQAAQNQKGGDAAVQWRWGSRAEAEIGEVGVARFLKAIYESKDGVAGEDDDNDAARRRRKGNTGEKLLNEISRAAGEGKLQDALSMKGL